MRIKNFFRKLFGLSPVYGSKNNKIRRFTEITASNGPDIELISEDETHMTVKVKKGHGRTFISRMP